MTMNLPDYVVNHTERGACRCGQCVDGVQNPEAHQPPHSVDVGFFQVAARDANAETLRELIRKHPGDFAKVDLFDGKEHGYIEIGAWIGDQGVALMLMGLGTVLGLWELLTPKSVLGRLITDEQAKQLMGQGMITILVKSEGK